MSEWNQAVEAAAKAVQTAPIFPKKGGGGPIADGERVIILSTCIREIEKLKRPE